MDKDEKDPQNKEADLFRTIGGLEPVDANSLRPFDEAMEKAIPDIVDAVEERRMLAAKSRRWQLKH